jgi:hypothetical protein
MDGIEPPTIIAHLHRDERIGDIEFYHHIARMRMLGDVAEAAAYNLKDENLDRERQLRQWLRSFELCLDPMLEAQLIQCPGKRRTKPAGDNDLMR